MDMGFEKKRSPGRDLSIAPDSSFTAESSSSAFSRPTVNNRSATLPPPPRSGSPPASAYFSQFSVDDTHEPRVAADASAHFAYSTTLRRHHPEGPLGFPQTPHGASLPTLHELRSVAAEEGPTGLWQRAVGTVKSSFPSSGSGNYERIPSHKEEHRETPSARFAHFSVDVSVNGSTLYVGYLNLVCCASWCDCMHTY